MNLSNHKKIFSALSVVLLVTLMFSGTAFAADNFLVIFMSDEETVYLNKPVARYAKVSEPEPPVKDGYTFGGWYTEPACINKFDFETRIPSKTTLYAKWTPVSESFGPSVNTTDGGAPAFKIPGFGMILGVLAVVGAVLLLGRKKYLY